MAVLVKELANILVHLDNLYYEIEKKEEKEKIKIYFNNLSTLLEESIRAQFDENDKFYKDTIEKLYIELYQSIMNLGGNIDRPNKRIAKIVYSKNPMYSNFLKSVKNQLDPNNIMNPGKLLGE